jgi:hypothetical protein
MGNIHIGFSSGVPQIVCTDCGNCDSIMGKSLCSISGRGCCHYFPEFTLVDIHRMVNTSDGLQALDIIINNPGTVINNNNIHAKGYFDKEGYDQYIKHDQLMETGSIRDHTIFFRACPFVKADFGCILPPHFRTTVCNFFICSEILDRPDLKSEILPYIEERSRYSRWIYRESAELQHILTENSVNLVTDFKASLQLLREIPLRVYEFPQLPPVEY